MNSALGRIIPQKRWKVDIVYRSENGPVDITHYVDEIEEVHDLVERGPHWDCLISCTITRFEHSSGVVPESSSKLTIEEAERL